MPTFQSALIALDLSAMDDTLLDYADLMTDVFDTEEAGLELVILDNTLLHTAEVILEYAHQQKTDLIIMGAKGNSPFENFLYGSTTERLVSMEKEFPVLVVR